jgi:hypothetical protein
MKQVIVKGRSGKLISLNQVRAGVPIQWYGRKQVTVPLYDWTFRDYLVDALTSRVDDGHDNIVIVTGPRRGGKSTFVSQAARAIDPKFSVSDVAFPLKEFNATLSRLPRAIPGEYYPQVVLDEAGWDLYAGNWMTKVSKNMVRKFEIIGEKGITVWLTLPHRMKLLKGIREDMGCYWISIRLLGERQERGYAILRRAEPNEWYEEAYWVPQAMFEFDGLTEDKDKWWAEYMNKKRAFVDFVAAEDLDTEPDSKRLERATAQRNILIKLLARRGGMKQAEIAEKLGVSPSLISTILGTETAQPA